MIGLIDRVPWLVALLLAVTLGLAPFVPEPHVWEKLKLLAHGALIKPIDVLDLAMHGAPWLVVALKAARMLRR
jgi:hypothetical protein